MIKTKFLQFYYQPNFSQLDESEMISELNIMNVIHKITGSAKRTVDPSKYEDTVEITQPGFIDILKELTDRYNDTKKEKRKYYVKDLFQGKFNPEKNNHPKFPEELDKEDIRSIAFYKTSNGGNIILYDLYDTTQNTDRYFISVDGKSQKFFAAEKKKGGLGMIFQTWLSTQKSSQNIFPDKQPSQKQSIPNKTIDQKTYQQLVPAESIIFTEAKKKARGIFWDAKEETWKVWRKNRSQRQPLASGPKELDYGVDPETGEESKEMQKKLESYRKTQMDEPDSIKTDDKEEPKEPTDSMQKDIDNGQKGYLYKMLKKYLEREPQKFGPTKNITIGWYYDLEGNNVIYVYENKEGKYKLAWKGQLAAKFLQQLGYIDRDDIKQLK